MKKMILSILFVLFLVCFVSCGTMYHSDAGEMSEVTGTYEITNYTKKNSENEPYDAMTEMQMKAYFVVTKDGYGYYIYKDKDTELIADTVSISYIYEEDSNLIKAVDYRTGKDVKLWNQKPGAGGEPIMGFNVKNHTLSYTIPYSHYKIGHQDTTIEYSSAVYTRVSEVTDLSYVEGKENTTIIVPVYELKNLTYLMYLECYQGADDYNKYDYFVFDFNNIKQKANIYYQLKGETNPVVLEDQDIVVKILNSEQPYYCCAKLTIPVLNKEFCLNMDSNGNPGLELYYNDENDNDGSKSEFLHIFFGTVTDYIESLHQNLN